MNKFILRPAYGSKELLIEFSSTIEKDSFISSLEVALSSIEVVITQPPDVCENEEIIFEANSTLGAFQISIDHWGLAFIMSKKNQGVIPKIGSILNESPYFEKEDTTPK